ncbi:phosphoribosyltransferase family protein [Sulfurospirillum sp. 1307]
MSSNSKYIFESRADATVKLLDVLPKSLVKNDSWILVCPSLQAVPIVNMVANKLNLNYDLLFCEPIYAPNNKECIIGMVSETEEIVLNNALVNSFEINLDFIYAEAHRQYEEKILPKVYKYRKGDLIGSLKNKSVLLIDEGCETGMTTMTAIKTIINAKAKSVSYATPILSYDVADSLEIVTDEIFSVRIIENFVDVEFYYKMLNELDTESVLEIISNSKNYLPLLKRGEIDGKNN